MTLNFYELLSVPRTATTEEIRVAHRHAMTMLHPDKGGSEVLSRKVNEARDTLCDPAARAAYDAGLAAAAAAPSQRPTTENPAPSDAERQDQPGGNRGTDAGTGHGDGRWHTATGERPHTEWGAADPWTDEETTTGSGTRQTGEWQHDDPWPGWDPWADWHRSTNQHQHQQQQQYQQHRPPAGGPSWLGRVNPAAPLMVTPPLQKSRWDRATLILGIGWGVLALAGVLIAAIGWGGRWVPVGIVLIAAWLGMGMLPPRAAAEIPVVGRRALTVAAGLAAVVMGLFVALVPVAAAGGLAAMPTSQAPHGIGGWAEVWGLFGYGVILLSGAITLAVATRTEPTRGGGGLDAVVGPTAVYQHNVFGTPGQRLQQAAATGALPRQQAAAGIAGEQASARLLETILAIPGCKLLHGLAWPGHPNADVDHALVCGRTVALIDSKLWKPGIYAVSPRGAVACDGHPVGDKHVHVGAAVRAWRRVLPAGTRVQAFVVAHAGGGGRIGFTSREGAGVRLCTAADAAEAIGDYLAPEAARVERRVLYRLLTENSTRRWTPMMRRPLLGPLARWRAFTGLR
jgi:hypothetical protein